MINLTADRHWFIANPARALIQLRSQAVVEVSSYNTNRGVLQPRIRLNPDEVEIRPDVSDPRHKVDVRWRTSLMEG